jgi:hypothetical protein
MVALIKQLFDDILEGLARYGCGVAGLPYYEDKKESSANLPLAHVGCATQKQGKK